MRRSSFSAQRKHVLDAARPCGQTCDLVVWDQPTLRTLADARALLLPWLPDGLRMERHVLNVPGHTLEVWRRKNLFTAWLKWQLQRPRFAGKLELSFKRLEENGERVFGAPHTAGTPWHNSPTEMCPLPAPPPPPAHRALSHTHTLVHSPDSQRRFEADFPGGLGKLERVIAFAVAIDKMQLISYAKGQEVYPGYVFAESLPLENGRHRCPFACPLRIRPLAAH